MGSTIRLTRATNLKEMAETLDEAPLTTPEQLKAFYKGEVQEARGVDRLGPLRLALEDRVGSERWVKAFVAGHPGAGKTTEIRHLMQDVGQRARPLWLSVADELNPGAIQHYDILLLMLMRLVREVTDPKVTGFDDGHMLDERLAQVREHLAKRWSTYLNVDGRDWGAGLEFPFLKLFGSLRGGTKREEHREEQAAAHASELIAVMNELLSECNRMLAKYHAGQQWIIVIDDFEKLGFSAQGARDFFIALRPHLEGLASHLILMVPVWLYHSDEASVVLPPKFAYHPLADIPVFSKLEHELVEKSVSSLEAVVLARAEASLFAPGVLRLFCVASGGNLRDLFSMIRDSTYQSRLKKDPAIGMDVAGLAIDTLREQYKNRLGEELDAKLERLKLIYTSEARAEVQDSALYGLLRQRCVLQYNGTAWKGVHPLVVDLLGEFKQLDEVEPRGGVRRFLQDAHG